MMDDLRFMIGRRLTGGAESCISDCSADRGRSGSRIGVEIISHKS
jgi:hypothetical protein